MRHPKLSAHAFKTTGEDREVTPSDPVYRAMREALWQAELRERRLRVLLWRGEPLATPPVPAYREPLLRQ